MNIANLRVRTRLFAGFGLLCAFLIAVIVLGTAMLGRIKTGTDVIVNNYMPKIEASNAVLTEVNNISIALRNMMLNADPADRKAQAADVDKARASIAATFDKLAPTIVSEEGKALLRQSLEYNGKFVAAQDVLLRHIGAGETEQASSYLVDEYRPLLAEYRKVINGQIDMQKKLAAQAALEADTTYDNTLRLMLALSAVILALAAIIAWRITASITTPVARALAIAETVAAGDLTSRIEVTTKDELGLLLAALKKMNDSLLGTVTIVRSSTELIASASSQVAAGSMDLSSRTEEQASALEETASSMEELTSTVRQNADNARQANLLAGAASSVAERGGAVVKQVVGTMDAIHASSQRMADIIGVIDGIAFQTNILALNAAVEAARAGEQGRGFAVVAAEVRNLAQRSATAAKEIKELIGDSVERVEAGSALVNEAGSTMTEIVASVKRVMDIMGEISAASAEQGAGIEQVNIAVTEMDTTTQQNAALVEEAAAAAAALREQTVALNEVVGVFKLDGDAPVDLAAPSRPVAAKSATRALPAASRASVRRTPAATAAAGGDWEAF